MQAIVHKIQAINVWVEPTNPPRLIVEAVGELPTHGWSNGRLSPVEYAEPPEDGLQEYQFIATPSHGRDDERTCSIRASVTWEDFPDWVRGVRVTTMTNAMAPRLSILEPVEA